MSLDLLLWVLATVSTSRGAKVFKAEWVTQLMAEGLKWKGELTTLHRCSVTGAELWETGWSQVCLACGLCFCRNSPVAVGVSGALLKVWVRSHRSVAFYPCFCLNMIYLHLLICFTPCVDFVLLSLEPNLKMKPTLCWFLDGPWLRMRWRLTQLEDFFSLLCSGCYLSFVSFWDHRRQTWFTVFWSGSLVSCY